MVAEIFQTIGEVVTAFTTALSNSVSGIVAMFYTSGEGGGLTVLGVLSLIAVGCGLVYWAFRLIRRLISQRRA